MTANQINELIESRNFKAIEELAITLSNEELTLWANWAYDGSTYVQIMNDRKRQAVLCA